MSEGDNQLFQIVRPSPVIPAGVKVIAVLYSIFGFIMTYLIGSSYWDHGLNILNLYKVIMVVTGVYAMFVAWGLWKAKHWARINAVVVAALSTLLMAIILFFVAVFALSGGLFGIFFIMALLPFVVPLIVSIAIGRYLLLNKNVKEAFA